MHEFKSMSKLEYIDNSITSFIPFYEYVCSKCKNGFYNMLLYRHLGDTYVMAGLKKEFETHYGGKLHYLVKPSQEIILKQFGIGEYTVIDLNLLLRDRLKNSRREKQDIDLLEEELYIKIFTSLPIKDVPFLGSHVRFVRETLKWDNFVNAWAKMFGLDVYSLDTPYFVPEMSRKLKKQLETLPPLDKLILLAPELQSFKWVPESYWHNIVLNYTKKGYTVVTNCLDSRSYVRDTINLELDVSDIIALGMRCYEVHSIRSGLCDILAAKEERLFVYYTQEMYNAYPSHYFSLNVCYNLNKKVNEILIPEEEEAFHVKVKRELRIEAIKLYQYLKRYKVVRGLNKVRNAIKMFIQKIKTGCRIWRKALKRLSLKTFHPRTLEDVMYAIDRWHDPLDVRISELGEENENKIIYFISLPQWWVPTAGFFALLNKTLCAISFADRMGFTMVVGNWDNCAYEVDACITGSDIIFEYYFEPLSDISYKSIMKSKNVCFSEPQNIDLIFHENNMENWFLPTDGYLKRMSEMYKKYIHLNSNIKIGIKEDIESLLKDKVTLGVHYRGTDYFLNCNGHPISITIDDYIEEIKRAIDAKIFEQIFIATDDLAAIEKFSKEFKNIIFYFDTYRVEGKVSIAYAKDTTKPNGYVLGYQVLRDAYTLAACDGLIGGKSQVCYGTQMIKYAMEEEFSYMKIIDKGINNNNNDWLNEYKKL